MSMDFIIYIDDISKINRNECEKYLNRFDMTANVHPKVDFSSHYGFLPFKVSKIKSEGKEILTGFEFTSAPYDYQEELSDLEGEEYLFDYSADEKLKKCNHHIIVTINERDPFGLRLVLAFSAYLCETCNGVFYDCFSGEIIHKDVQNIMKRRIAD